LRNFTKKPRNPATIDDTNVRAGEENIGSSFKKTQAIAGVCRDLRTGENHLGLLTKQTAAFGHLQRSALPNS
jgi:hypothetical protein